MAKVLCCMCGVLIDPNSANTCSTCLASTSDITRGVSTDNTLHQCRGCQRWHKSEGKWMACELESRELMGLCLSHVSGLKGNKTSSQQIRVVDAAWIWTEPHSMRLKVRLTVQREVQSGTILQQSFTVTFTVRNQQCTECQSEFRQGSWVSLVQVRQRVSHKRTFLYLEQLIIKHGAQRGSLSIEAFRDGMDFYFPDRGKAARFISFLEDVVPVKVKTSKKLISTDVKSNISNYKFTSFVEICPLCKDDLLHLPVKVARNLGNISRLVLVKNISSLIHLIDPLTGQTASMSADVYWRDSIRPIVTAARSRMSRYVVLGQEAVFLRKNVSRRTPNKKQRSRLANLTLAREEDLGLNDVQYEELSYVGYLMKSGDVCVGYDLKDTTLADDEAETVRGQGGFPNAVIIRKLYGGAANTDESASSKKNRVWRLERLAVKAGEEESNSKKKVKGGDQDGMDEEDFMREVEADKEMRLNMNLYKNDNVKKLPARTPSMETHENKSLSGDVNMVEDEEDEDEDDQQIKLDELLDGLALDEPADPAAAAAAQGTDLAQEGLISMYEEGERAAKDGLKYVSREDVRNIREKDAPVVVSAATQSNFTDSL
eukprot:CAMPEP_0198146086 /NCGR_PEP_ID=MMETSP1443-20131203/27294_1 /TAXON_ID=186043 /ORGANISM="Entomoneis sp., Strain CCMP2396" /LENGTH=599 /DNA_ID=CAMNT_0043809921 /DNA_START=47 /DNA_END=1846 /DNA_ORIENTATION=-